MNKVYDGIMGLVVGDALGVPYEFANRGTFTAEGMKGFGTYNQPPGTWSDDSSMTLATMDAIIKNKGVMTFRCYDHIMQNFVTWYQNGNFTPYGRCFDVGGTTRRAIQNYLDGCALWRCGGYTFDQNGNGSLMRILPIAYIPGGMAGSLSMLTHQHIISLYACEVYVDIARRLLQYENVTPIQAYSTTVHNMKNGFFFAQTMPEYERFYHLQEMSRQDINSSGYVVDTLEAAVWCLLTTDNYADCVLKAVNLGGDTDTVAAVAGGLAGITYGAKSIPEDWIAEIPKKDYIKDLCDKFNDVVQIQKSDNKDKVIKETSNEIVDNLNNRLTEITKRKVDMADE